MRTSQPKHVSVLMGEAGNLSSFAIGPAAKKYVYYQQLTTLAKTILPKELDFYVVAWQGGQLTVSTTSTTFASQLRYMQQHYVALLKAQKEFNSLLRIKTVYMPPLQSSTVNYGLTKPKALSAFAQQQLMIIKQALDNSKPS